MKAIAATAITAGTNQPDTVSASRWIGARLRWASATIWTMRASMVSRPIFSARITRPPVWLIVPPISFDAGFLGHGHGLASDHRFIDRAAALDHHAINRNLLAGRMRSVSPTRTTSRA
jgi:hypothetical protein